MLYSVVIPCYNEEPVLEETHKRLSSVMAGMDGDYELIYVNDGSRDRTAAILRELYAADPAHVRVIMFARNRGHQTAVTAGLDYALGNAVVIIDADLQDPPEVIPQMAEKWKAGTKVVYGQRKARDGETAFKKITASLYYKIVNGLTGGMIPKDTGDFRLIDRQVADVIRSMPEHDRFLRGMFAWIGFEQEPVLYDRDKRFAGETHYTLKKMIRLAADGIFGFTDKPLKLSLWIGVADLMIAVILALVLLITGTAGLWWIADLILAVAGGLHLCIGFAGEYIKRIYDEARQRPLYIAAETLGCNRSGAAKL